MCLLTTAFLTSPLKPTCITFSSWFDIDKSICQKILVNVSMTMGQCCLTETIVEMGVFGNVSVGHLKIIVTLAPIPVLGDRSKYKSWGLITLPNHM